MPRRSQTLQRIPWVGGINTSTDAGIIPDTDLQTADNVIFSATGARLKREGFDYWDVLSDVPTVTYRASSGTTRTLTFSSKVNETLIDRLVAGEGITVSTTAAGNETTYYAITAGTIITAAADGYTITYTAVGSLSEGTTATTTLTVIRRNAIIKIIDYWRFTGSALAQSVVAITNQPKIFRYDSAGRRKEVEKLGTAAATAVLNLTTDITLTSVSLLSSRVGTTFRTEVLAAAANPTNTILVSFTGSASAIVCTITPNDGTNNGAVAVNLTTANLVQLINTGAVTGKTVTITDASSLRALQTAAGGDTTNVANGGEADSVSATFSGGATTRVTTASRADAVVFNEDLIVAQEGLGNTPLMYNPDDNAAWVNLPGAPPDFSIMAVHLNRVWTNDKNNRDRINYCATGNAQKWNGLDDSGALDIRPGDGDPVGVIGFKVFKGRLFVSKKNKIYQVVGDTPENFQILDVSQGVGTESHLANAAVDQDDVLYLSSKGAHSLATTANYGDFTSSYLSAKIQPTYNQFTKARLPFTQAAYVPTINSVAFTVSEQDSNFMDTIWLYNTQVKEWYRWPEVDAQSLGVILLASTPTLFYGTSDGKMVSTQNGEYTDFGTTGIRYRIKSGTIYPDASPHSIKAFKRLTLFFRPVGSYSFVCRVKIDNYSEQILVFSQEDVSADLLDVSFILGSSLLGASSQFSPNSLPIDGYGRGCTVEVEQTGTDEQIAIYGYAIEYEMADMSQENIVDEEP